MFGYPFDVIRTVLVYNDFNQSQISVIKNIYSTNGIRGFFRGIYPSLIFTFFDSGIILYLNDLFKRSSTY